MKGRKKGKLEKTRVLREALDEEDTEVDVDRMGKPAKTEKKAGKMKGMSKEERLAEKKKKRERKKKKNEAKDKKKEMKEKKMDAKEKKKEMKEKKMEKMEKKEKKEKKKSKDSKEKKLEAKRKRKNKDVRESRSNRKNRNKKNKGQNKNKTKLEAKRKRKNKRGRDSSKNNEKKGRKGNDGKEEKMVGSLSGIATMIRDGDVTVVDEETHKVVTSEFSVGPLQLQVSKIYGRGKARTVKTAKAITDVMSGTLVLKVKPDGTAHVKKVVFKKPENVE